MLNITRVAILSAVCMVQIHSALAQNKNNSTSSQSQVQGQTYHPLVFDPGTPIPTGAAPPALRVQINQGVKLISLGEISSGIMGYLGESTDGKFKVFYVMPDGITMVVGTAFRIGNQPTPTLENLTAQQGVEMSRRINISRQQTEETRRVSVEIAELARKNADEAARSQQDRLYDLNTRSQKVDDALRQISEDNPTSSVVVPLTSPQVTSPNLDLPSVSTPPVVMKPRVELIPVPDKIISNEVINMNKFASPIDKNKLIADLDNKNPAWVDIGSASAPMLLMIVDPKCVFCHKAWLTIKPLIEADKVRARVVLISASPSSDSATISLLSRKDSDISDALLVTGEGSTDGISISSAPLAGTPEYAKGLDATKRNMEFVQRYTPYINKTPYLAYVSSDGQLRSLDGIKDLDGFLKGLPAVKTSK